LVYQYYRDGNLVEEAELEIAMRIHYPEQLERLVLDHGFEIVEKWGGYNNEAYGEGPEQVIQFRLPSG
jgi:hypothetical protein